MKNFSNISKWFLGSVIWSALFISLAAYSAQKAVEADPEIEEKLSQHFSEKWGTTINVSLDADSSDQNSDQKKDEWIIKNSITNIQIETINGDIEIVTVPDKNNIQISARGKLNKKKAPRLLEVLESEKELSITQPDQSAVKSLQLKIEIPESYSGELIVNTVTGDFSANNFKPENIKLNSISGDISFVDITSNQVQLKSVSGDINLDNVLAKELESITTSGDVSIHFPGLQNDIKFDIQTVSGDIDNQNKSAGQGIRRYKVNTVSGDVEIR